MVPVGREGIGAISINQWLVDVWWGDLRNPKKPLWKELLLGDMCTVEYEKIVYHQRPLILTTLPLVDRYWGKRRKKSWSLLIRFFAHIKSCWYYARYRNGVTAPVLQEVLGSFGWEYQLPRNGFSLLITGASECRRIIGASLASLAMQLYQLSVHTVDGSGIPNNHLGYIYIYIYIYIHITL